MKNVEKIIFFVAIMFFLLFFILIILPIVILCWEESFEFAIIILIIYVLFVIFLVFSVYSASKVSHCHYSENSQWSDDSYRQACNDDKRNEMEQKVSIARAVQNGDKIDVYDTHNILLYSKFGHLEGYTDKTVTIKEMSGWIISYDADGHNISDY